MRAPILILILVVVALIIAIQTGFLDITQTRSAEVPQVSTNGASVTAEGGQTPAFDVETGSVAVGSNPRNVTVQVPTVEVRPPAVRRALDLAAIAAEAGEVPVGAVITCEGEIVAEARNAMRGQLDPTAHAEMVAIRHAATRLGRPRL